MGNLNFGSQCVTFAALNGSSLLENVNIFLSESGILTARMHSIPDK